MELQEVRRILKIALARGEAGIIRHIRAKTAIKRTGGIERAFSIQFEAELPKSTFTRERPLSLIGAVNEWEDREGGRIDCHITDSNTAIEYKALRMPRIRPNIRWDVGPLAADWWRLAKATKVDRAYLIVFAYGPLVSNTTTGHLYKNFHNQMFVDLTLARQEGQVDFRNDFDRRLFKLGWEAPHPNAKIPPWAVVVLGKNVGAIAIDCLAP